MKFILVFYSLKIKLMGRFLEICLLSFSEVTQAEILKVIKFINDEYSADIFEYFINESLNPHT